MLSFLALVHIFLAIVLIIFVLLQDSKGGAMGVFGGGSSSSVFGSTGGTNFLASATKYTAILFSATCIYLAYATSHKGTSVIDGYVPTKTEATETTTPNAGATPAEPGKEAAPEKAEAPTAE